MKNRSNPIHVYSKQIKDKEIKSDKIIRNIDKTKLLGVIRSLVGLGKEKEIDELELKENCRDWIENILSNLSEFSESHLKYLLNDFTDEMKTRMREEEKYAISILSEEGLLLCHSIYGEETITPAWKVIPRMIDKDNVIRFVYFKKDDKSIKVTYYEQQASDFLVGWLGIPEKEAFYYLGGRNRLYTEISGLHCALELTDEELEKKFIEGNELKIDNNQLLLSSPLQRLQITQIRVGKKRYKGMGDFLQDFLAKKYELSYYQEQYQKLRNSLKLLTNKFIDEKDKLIIIENGKDKQYLKKRNPNFYILFNDEKIEIRNTFFNEIFIKFLNNIPIKIFHAGSKLCIQPLKIKSMEIFNDLKLNEINNNIINFYHTTQLRDEHIDKSLCYTIFHLLRINNRNKAISYFFDELIKKLCKEINISKTIVQNEDIIEFKSRDLFVGNDEEISKKLAEDLKKKLKDCSYKIYIIGADEKGQKFEPITDNRVKSDRITNIEKLLHKEINAEINLIKLPKEGEGCILLLIANIKNEEK